jgi:hypothetical protein
MPRKLSPLTDTECGNLRAALVYLRAQTGSWAVVAKAVRSKRVNLRRVRAGQRINGMRSLAARVARLGGVRLEAVLAGNYQPPGTCRHWGRPRTTWIVKPRY